MCVCVCVCARACVCMYVCIHSSEIIVSNDFNKDTGLVYLSSMYIYGILIQCYSNVLQCNFTVL